MNILLTSVGRRTYIVEYFKDILKDVGGTVHAFNSSADSAASVVADCFTVAPLVNDKSYEDFLFNYCVNNQIQMVISLFDIELPFLSKFKQRFKAAGVSVVVGDEWLTLMANDKWETKKFLEKNDFSVIKSTLDLEDLKNNNFQYPVILKPRYGMGSIGIYEAQSYEEAEFFYALILRSINNSYLKYQSQLSLDSQVIIQEKLELQEYGLDIINDLLGNYQTTIVKRKIAMRSGETDIAITEKNHFLETIGQRIASLSQHPGIMDVDVFYDGHEAFVLELNPRFGGGYPFSHIAGVNLPKAMVNWYLNQNFDASSLLKAQAGVKGMKGIHLLVSNGKI